MGHWGVGGRGRDLRAGVFARVGDFSAQEVSRFGAPTLISRNTNDVTQVQQVVFMGAAMMVSAPIMMVGGIVMALREDVGLSWLVAVAVPLLAGPVEAQRRARAGDGAGGLAQGRGVDLDAAGVAAV